MNIEKQLLLKFKSKSFVDKLMKIYKEELESLSSFAERNKEFVYYDLDDIMFKDIIEAIAKYDMVNWDRPTFQKFKESEFRILLGLAYRASLKSSQIKLDHEKLDKLFKESLAENDKLHQRSYEEKCSLYIGALGLLLFSRNIKLIIKLSILYNLIIDMGFVNINLKKLDKIFEKYLNKDVFTLKIGEYNALLSQIYVDCLNVITNNNIHKIITF